MLIGDTQAPDYSIESDPTEWTHGPQTIKVFCEDKKQGDDSYVSGCQESIYKIVLKNKNDAHKYAKEGLTIRDKAGNTKKIDLKTHIKVDYDPPTCPSVKGYIKTSINDITSPGNLSQINSDVWSNKWIFTKATDSKDQFIEEIGGVGFSHYLVTVTGASDNVKDLKQEYRNINKEGLSTVTYQACDKLGNCTDDCGSFKVKLDRTPPDCGSKTGESTTWSNAANRVVGINCSKGSGSDCDLASYTTIVSDETKTKNLSFSIKDKAGNSKVCSNTYNIYLDRTAPVISYNNTNDGYTLNATARDSLSGVTRYNWQNEGASSVSATTQISASKTIGTSNGAAINFYATDAAGNASSKATGTYRWCSKTKWNGTGDLPAWSTVNAVGNMSMWNGMVIFKLTYSSKDCGKGKDDKNVRKYAYQEHACQCNLDKYNSKFCSFNRSADYTTATHSNSTASIYYAKTDNGVKACKGDINVNSYVIRFCNSTATAGGTFQHGYYVYSGAVGAYNNFSPGSYWHNYIPGDPGNRISSAYDVGTACTHACKVAYGSNV